MVNLTAQFLYGVDAARRLERFDMGEYQHPDSVKRLLGAPDQPPLLGRAINRLNALGGGILLLDEIEKAFPDLLTALLSFDSARSTMFDGTICDLTPLIVVLTSNLGAAEAARMENSGYSAISRKLRYAAEERFKKEGVARFTSVNCMNVLGYAVQEQITRNLLAAELALQADHLGAVVQAGPEVVTFLISKGFSPDLGARNIRNCVERFVGQALEAHSLGVAATRSFRCHDVGDAMLDRWSDAVVISVDGDRLVARPIERSPALTDLLERAHPVSADGDRTAMTD
jgi:ATP-dependent Clp protease ATP-binding subunit ClpA